MDIRRQVGAVAIVALLAISVLAANGERGVPNQIVGSGYNYDRTNAAYRTTLQAADSLTTTAVLAVPAFNILGRQTLILQGRFSNASETCTVQVAYVNKLDPDVTASDTATTNNKIKHWSNVYTLTAGTAQKEGSYFESAPLFIDSMGAPTLRILLISGPVHTVDFWAGSE